MAPPKGKKAPLKIKVLTRAEEKKKAVSLKPRDMAIASVVVLLFILIDLYLYHGKEKGPSETKVTATLPARAGVNGGASRSTASPEILSVRFSPVSPVRGDVIKAEVSTQPRNGLPVSLRYLWSINGNVISETSDSLSGDIKKGDKVSVTVTPSDEKGTGNPFTVDTFIYNAPPAITSSIQDAIYNGGFTYQVIAKDPDNDQLRYFLRGSPEGMTIDPATGLVKWDIPPGYKGTENVLIAVSDSEGGEATQLLNLQLGQ